ncbi:hypothetical protein SAMN05445504_9088 [Burkholderia sp. CF099]|nr:hypothetical protein SAMN05445504_9088 [Burkholderia sp. CF099]
MRRENFLRDEEYSRLYFVLLLIEQHVPFTLKVADRYAVSNVRMRPANASAPISELFSSTHTPISTPFSAPVASDESPRTGPSVQSPRTPCVHCRPVVPRFSACTATPIAGRRGAGGKTNQQPSSWRKNMIFKERGSPSDSTQTQRHASRRERVMRVTRDRPATSEPSHILTTSRSDLSRATIGVLQRIQNLHSCNSSAVKRPTKSNERERIADEPVVGPHRRSALLPPCYRHDHLRVHHACKVLDRARDAHRDVQLWRDDLAGLANLVVVRHVACVDRCARRAKCCAELVGERLQQLFRANSNPICCANDGFTVFPKRRSCCLDDLNCQRRGLATTDAQTRDASRLAALAECAEERHDEARARCADRVTQRASTSMHVHALVRKR